MCTMAPLFLLVVYVYVEVTDVCSACYHSLRFTNEVRERYDFHVVYHPAFLGMCSIGDSNSGGSISVVHSRH